MSTLPIHGALGLSQQASTSAIHGDTGRALGVSAGVYLGHPRRQPATLGSARSRAVSAGVYLGHPRRPTVKQAQQNAGHMSQQASTSAIHGDSAWRWARRIWRGCLSRRLPRPSTATCRCTLFQAEITRPVRIASAARRSINHRRTRRGAPRTADCQPTTRWEIKEDACRVVVAGAENPDRETVPPCRQSYRQAEPL